MEDLELKREAILALRNKYQKSLRKQLEEIMWLSQDNDDKGFRKAMDEMETTLVILWRFDRKLQNAKALEALLESFDPSDESIAGSTS